jgi:hypothetical protein
MTPLPASAPDPWRARLQALRADVARRGALRTLAASRLAANAEVPALVRQLLARTLSLHDFRTTFDSKTRDEWSCIGASGPSGAMVVNQIDPQTAIFPAIERAWRQLLSVPASPATADAAIQRMVKALDDARDVSETPTGIPQNARIAVIASVLCERSPSTATSSRSPARRRRWRARVCREPLEPRPSNAERTSRRLAHPSRPSFGGV